MKRKIIIALGVIAVVLLCGLLFITDGLSEGRNIAINGVSLSNKPDGGYTGIYNFKRWSNTLKVNVKDGMIMSIEVVKDVKAAKITHCSEETFRRVIEAQDTKVDAVSGATVTSKAYLKAIENALE